MSGFVHLNGETDGESEQGRQRRQGAPNIGLSAAIDVDAAAAAAAAAAVLNDRKSSGTEQIGLTYVRCSQPNMLTWSDSEENAKA